MSQSDFGTMNPNTESGTQLATDLNNYRNARDTKNSGTSRPGYAVAGMEWMNTSGATYPVYLFDGTNDVLLGTLNPTTHVYVPSLATLPDGGAMTASKNQFVANVGLGGAPSAWPSSWSAFQLGTNGPGFLATYNGVVGDVILGSNFYQNGSSQNTYVANGYASSFSQYQGAFTWQTAASGTAGNAVTFSSLMTLDASGKWLLGMTSVLGAASGWANIWSTNGGQAGLIIGNNVGSASTSQIGFVNSNGVVGQISTSGTATSYVTSSDYRLKHDPQPIANALASIMQVKPYNFAWNSDNSRTNGFYAHELAEVEPSCVVGAKDAVDDDGKPVYQGVDQGKLTPLLTAALQELSALVTAQAATIATLQAQVAALTPTT